MHILGSQYVYNDKVHKIWHVSLPDFMYSCGPESALQPATSVQLVNIQHTVTRYFQMVHPRSAIITYEFIAIGKTYYAADHF